jgi:hypothetical protein
MLDIVGKGMGFLGDQALTSIDHQLSLASLDEGEVHGQTKFGIQAAVTAAVVNWLGVGRDSVRRTGARRG